jgi:hypothetical protein
VLLYAILACVREFLLQQYACVCNNEQWGKRNTKIKAFGNCELLTGINI